MWYWATWSVQILSFSLITWWTNSQTFLLRKVVWSCTFNNLCNPCTLPLPALMYCLDSCQSDWLKAHEDVLMLYPTRSIKHLRLNNADLTTLRQPFYDLFSLQVFCPDFHSLLDVQALIQLDQTSEIRSIKCNMWTVQWFDPSGSLSAHRLENYIQHAKYFNQSKSCIMKNIGSFVESSANEDAGYVLRDNLVEVLECLSIVSIRVHWHIYRVDTLIKHQCYIVNQYLIFSRSQQNKQHIVSIFVSFIYTFVCEHDID